MGGDYILAGASGTNDAKIFGGVNLKAKGKIVNEIGGTFAVDFANRNYMCAVAGAEGIIKIYNYKK